MTQSMAVIGAGLIGRAWASIFARAGWMVRLYDPVEGQADRCHRLCAEALVQLARHGLCADADGALARISVAASLPEALADVVLVQENAPEQVEVKRELYAKLDRLSPPDAILASSTSAIVASKFTEELAGRHRCLVAHPVNPPHLVPVVELCGAPWTSEAVIEHARAIYAEIGQVPILVKKEVEGFILNRLQGALLTESMRLVGEGYVSPQDLDHVVKNGLGLRWSFLGPFETIELNAPGGIPDYIARYSAFYQRLACDPAPPSAWQGEGAARVSAEWGQTPDATGVEQRSRARDERLAALQAHKRSMED
ncbi:FadB 3-hydroxyacyl-CoA dehydrogenase [Rhabdaerophilaceae bacterium]